MDKKFAIPTRQYHTVLYSFVYDPFADDYKVVGVFIHMDGCNSVAGSKVLVYTLRTDSLESILSFLMGLHLVNMENY